MIEAWKDNQELKLSELLSCLADYRIAGDKDPVVSGIHYNSEMIRPGQMFVCIPGSKFDGHDFAKKAIRNRAACILSNRVIEDIHVPQVIVSDTRTAMGLLAATLFSLPSSKLTIIGITGTNGKTTTSLMLASIMRASGKKPGVIGTLGIYIDKDKVYEGRTTPESVEIQKYLMQMVSSGVKVCVSEVSSHAIDQGRYAGTRYDVLIFTNATQDHLDYHGDMQSYMAAKSKLFKDKQAHKEGMIVVYNADDPNAENIVGAKSKRNKLVSYGLGKDCMVTAKVIDTQIKGSVFEIENKSAKSKLKINLALPGMFNIYNSLAATAAASSLGITDDHIISGLESVRNVPGRTEVINGGAFSVVIDYAHTPDGLTKVLSSLKECTKGRLITVFGCGGDRDKAKRPLMGMIANQLSDFSVVTSDNPRSEDPLEIIKQITGKMKNRYLVEIDRKKAIIKAISMAGKNDCVVIAGKGHETYQEVDGKKSHFNDGEIVKEVLERN